MPPDLLDESASRLRMKQESRPDDIAALERDILTAKIEFEALRKEADAASVERRTTLEARLAKDEVRGVSSYYNFYTLIIFSFP